MVTADTIARETAGLRRLALALVRDAAGAEDLVQETWLSAVKAVPASDRPIRPWLARVLRNAAAGAARSAGRARAREDAVATSTSTEAGALDQAQVLRQLVEEIEQLPADDRDLLVLVYWQGLSSAECAAELGRPPSTIRTQLHRAIARLRKRLDDRRGGRAAWMGALLPMVSPRPVVGTKAVAIATLLGLVGVGVVLAPHGCGSELGQSAVSELEPSRAARREAPPPAMGAIVERDVEPVEAKPAAKPTDEDDVLARHRSKHPKLGYAWALQQMRGSLAECRERSGAGSVRVTPAVIFSHEHEPLVESVQFEEVDNVSAEELECLKQTLLALDIPAPETLDAAWEGERYAPTSLLSFDASGALTERAISRGPATWVPSQTKLGDDLKAAVAECDPNAEADSSVEVRVTYDAVSGALVDARARGIHADSEIGRCAEAMVRDHARSTNTFEPRRPEDASIDCTFQLGVLGVFVCRRLGPDGTYLPAP